ncbi:MAG: carboxypeptidase regulatory-like domain-containing protein [Acidobacteria bacterium]|nr:carboxypeptidase regulatory-like domain-containing protein [Acidobacteriota bacterium]MBV9069145.1 carboxypeptidase regulatory-like domain-containing protein [Acidobacteriota bacterium]MBV9185357.1 carboxypeptidase regulatory-like domain-containing protein [Acidobacteriota bacterium]
MDQNERQLHVSGHWLRQCRGNGLLHVQCMVSLEARLRIGRNLLAILLVACSTQAAQIRTTTDSPSVAVRTVVLRAERSDGGAEHLEQPVPLPGTADLPLGKGLWQLRVIDEHLWAAPLFLRNEDSVTVKVWPTVPLRGTTNPLTALRVGFKPLDTDGAAGEVDCSVKEDSWVCAIPVGKYDLRFASTGFAPEFRFNVSLRNDPKPIPLKFVPGASLSGRVEAVRGVKLSAEGVTVTMTAAGGGEGAAWKDTARSNAKGFFQFKGVAPGDYSIRGEGKGGLTTEPEHVEVLAGVAAELNASLLLDLPKKLTVIVFPRLDPYGDRWIVRMVSNNPRHARGEVMGESPVSNAGDWTHTRLIAGTYEVDVLTSRGELWKVQEVTIEHDDVTVAVACLSATITGSVKLGEHPLKASLSFGGENWPKIESDSEGRFTGAIPPGEQEERSLLVEAETPRLRRTIRAHVEKDESGGLHLDIELPATTLMGRVLNQDRSPVPYALLTVSNLERRDSDQAFGERDGSFQVAGYEPGTYGVTAESGPGSKSRETKVVLRDGELTEVDLLIEKAETVRGRITVGEVPVIAADIYAFLRDTSAPFIPQARTDESGFFEIELPPGTTTFDGLVIHPAFDVMFGRATIQHEKQLNIRTQQIGGTVILESTPKNVLLLHGGAEVYAAFLADRSGGSIAPGRLTVPRLEPGHYTACTWDKAKCVNGYLPPHGTLTLSLPSETH